METTLDFGEIPPIWRIQFIAQRKNMAAGMMAAR